MAGFHLFKIIAYLCSRYFFVIAIGFNSLCALEKRMMSKKTNDGKCLSCLLSASKLFCVFLFLFFQNFKTQIYVSGDAQIYSEKVALISQPDSLVLRTSKSKIYISSGVKISNHESLKNYEIVEILPCENKKLEPKKQSVLNIAKTQSEKKVEQKLSSKKENHFFYKHTFSTSKSEVYFSFVGGFSKISVLVSQFNAKQIINSESCKAALSFRRIKLASEHFKKDELLTVQKWFAFSVRPPPFLI